MSLWGRPGKALILALFIFVSCEEDTYLLGFQKPDRNFKVSYVEFKIPTSVVVLDSVNTVNGTAAGETKRLLTGKIYDDKFGNTTAVAFTQFAPPALGTSIAQTAIFTKLTLTLVGDYYHYGDPLVSQATFNVVKVQDSLVNSLPYFNNSMVSYEDVLGIATHDIRPLLWDEDLAYNQDPFNTTKRIDSLNVDLSTSFGQVLFDAARDTTVDGKTRYLTFSKFRRIFKGLAIVPVSADKIMGIDPSHVKSRLTLYYEEGAAKKSIVYTINPGSSTGVLGFSQITTDRSGTMLSGANSYYQEIQPPDGLRYVQGGTGVITKLDFTEVYNYFKDIPVKALNVAELTIESIDRERRPERLYLRALKSNNRYRLGITTIQNIVGDTLTILDNAFSAKHLINLNSSGTVDVRGDDPSSLMTLDQTSDSPTIYRGYLTSFFQKEFALADADYLNLFALIPFAPNFSKSVNGLYFDKENIILKIYYTTPIQAEQ